MVRINCLLSGASRPKGKAPWGPVGQFHKCLAGSFIIFSDSTITIPLRKTNRNAVRRKIQLPQPSWNSAYKKNSYKSRLRSIRSKFEIVWSFFVGDLRNYWTTWNCYKIKKTYFCLQSSRKYGCWYQLHFAGRTDVWVFRSANQPCSTEAQRFSWSQ